MTRWLKTIRLGDVFHNDDMSLKEKAEKIRDAFRLRISEDDDFELDMLLDDLIDAGDADSITRFDAVWNAIYDWADENSVWIDTFTKEEEG